MSEYVRLVGAFRKVDKTLMECDGCHAVTTDPEAHLRWHYRSNVPIGKTYMGAAGWQGDILWVEMFEDANELALCQNANATSLTRARQQKDEAALIERFRKALMEAHSDDWDMETIAEAAHICAKVAP